MLSLLALGVGFSRVYLGVHSVTQVLSGGILSLCYSHLFLVVLYRMSMGFLYKIMSMKYTAEKQNLLVRTTVLIALVFNSIGVLAYFLSLQENNSNIHLDEYERIMLQKCPKCSNYRGYLGWKNLKDYLYGNTIFGILLMYLVQRRQPFLKNNRFYVSQPTSLKIKRIFLTIIVTILFCAPGVVGKVYFDDKWSDIVSTVLVSYSLSAGLLWALPRVFRFCNASVSGDFVNLKPPSQL